MNKIRKSKKILLISLVLLVVMYFLIPSISKIIIEKKLPDNIKLVNWDMNYLGLNQVCLNHIAFKVELEKITSDLFINNLCVNYLTRDIQVESILSKQKESLPSSKKVNASNIFPLKLAILLLPEQDFSFLNDFKKIGKININKIENSYITNNKNNYELSINDFKVRQNSLNKKIPKLELKINEFSVKNNNKSLFKGSLNTSISPTTSIMSIINSSRLQLAKLEYNQTTSQISTSLSINSQWIKKYLTSFTDARFIKLMPIGDLELEVLRDKLLSQQTLTITTQLPSTSKEHENYFRSHLSLDYSSNNNSIKTELMTNLKADGLILKNDIDDRLYEVNISELNSVTNFNINTASGYLQSIDKINNVTNIETINISENNPADNKQISTIKLQHLKTSLVNLAPIELMAEIGVSKPFSLEGKVNAQLISATRNTDNSSLTVGNNELSETANLDAKFSLKKENVQYSSAGTVTISNTSLDAKQSIDKKIEYLNSDVEIDVDWKNLLATINTNSKKSNPTIDSANINIDIKGNGLSSSKLDLSEFIIHSKTEVINNQLNSNGFFNISDQNLTNFLIFNKDILSQHESYKIKLDNKIIPTELVSQIADSLLLKTLPKDDIPLVINKGEIEHDNQILIGDKINVASTVILNDFDIDINNIFLVGLDYKQTIDSIEPIAMTAKLDIKEVTLASGLLISNIASQIDVKSEGNKESYSSKNINQQKIDLSVSDFKANLWNGKIRSESITFENGVLKPTTIKLNEIDLTEMLFFLDVKGLYVDGAINIELPIDQEEGQFVVANGQFSSIKPGLIKYDSGQTQIDVEANIALHALQDFHYKNLSGTINYHKSGAYEIKLHLLGSNPNLYDGYPIDFNLNLNGKLSDVFQSVFLTGDFEKSIIEKAKMEKQKKN